MFGSTLMGRIALAAGALIVVSRVARAVVRELRHPVDFALEVLR